MEHSISSSKEWQELRNHVEDIEQTHLRTLIRDTERCKQLIKLHDGVYIDFCRQRATEKTVALLMALAEKAGMKRKIAAMFEGQRINVTEDRAVLHVALRAQRDEVIQADGRNVVPDVWAVLDKIKGFSEKVRSGEWKGQTGKPLKNVVAIGIGGSFLGPLFVHEALRFDSIEAQKGARDRKLRFLANVDPIDVARALVGLQQEETLVVIISKTFTTAETMLNARTVRTWLRTALGEEAVAKHMVAVSTNKKEVERFGIDPANMFPFWDWVGGRYSVCSAVGMLPLSLQYGFDVMERFLQGANAMDHHFRDAPFEDNIPVLLGLFGLWNSSFLGHPARAILPYCQALSKFAPHIQQVSMESNGKGVDIEGNRVPFNTGEVEFGEPGTNGQHSFYQLIHQGRVIPCEFIGVVRSQQSVYLRDEIVSNHDELMCNFFAQADALAEGKTPVQLRSEGVSDALIPHRTFTGNRPSVSILLPELTAYTVGQLLATYEHRIAVQGFVWNLNSFDQWGVELGKVLATRMRATMNDTRVQGRLLNDTDGYNYSTRELVNNYLKRKTKLLYPEPRDVFPVDILRGERTASKNITNEQHGQAMEEGNSHPAGRA